MTLQNGARSKGALLRNNWSYSRVPSMPTAPSIAYPHNAVDRHTPPHDRPCHPPSHVSRMADEKGPSRSCRGFRTSLSGHRLSVTSVKKWYTLLTWLIISHFRSRTPASVAPDGRADILQGNRVLEITCQFDLPIHPLRPNLHVLSKRCERRATARGRKSRTFGITTWKTSASFFSPVVPMNDLCSHLK